MRKSCFPDNTHSILFLRRRSPASRRILSDLCLPFLLFHCCHNTHTMIDTCSCKMRPDHHGSSPHQLNSGDMRPRHQVSAYVILSSGAVITSDGGAEQPQQTVWLLLRECQQKEDCAVTRMWSHILCRLSSCHVPHGHQEPGTLSTILLFRGH